MTRLSPKDVGGRSPTARTPTFPFLSGRRKIADSNSRNVKNPRARFSFCFVVRVRRGKNAIKKCKRGDSGASFGAIPLNFAFTTFRLKLTSIENSSRRPSARKRKDTTRYSCFWSRDIDQDRKWEIEREFYLTGDQLFFTSFVLCYYICYYISIAE